MNELKKEDTRMNVDDAVRELSRQEFLDKLYGFAYKRCYSAHEAEDLCADINCGSAVVPAARAEN